MERTAIKISYLVGVLLRYSSRLSGVWCCYIHVLAVDTRRVALQLEVSPDDSPYETTVGSDYINASFLDVIEVHVCCSERLASRDITLLGLPQTWCLHRHTRPFGLNCGRLLAYDLGPGLPNYCHANPIRRRGNCMRRVIFMILHLLSLYNVIFNRNCAVSTGHLQAVWYMGRLL